jgi:outer membrane protein assembly factor BamB
MIVGQPLLAAGILYVCVPDVTYALDAHDGAVRWQRETGCEVAAIPFADYAQPILAGGLLYSGSFALDPQDGSVRWRLPPNSSPGAVGHGMLYAYSEEFVYALDADSGRLRWQYVFDDVAGDDRASAGNIVYVSDLNFEVTAFTASSGKKVWSRYIANFSSISAGCGTSLIYVGAGLALYALDAATGKQIWAYQTGGRAYPSMASCAGDALFFTGDSIYAVNAVSGVRRWQTSVGAYLTFTAPTLVDGILFVGETGSVNGVLYALSASTGKVLWHVGGIDHMGPLVAG